MGSYVAALTIWLVGLVILTAVVVSHLDARVTVLEEATINAPLSYP